MRNPEPIATVPVGVAVAARRVWPAAIPLAAGLAATAWAMESVEIAALLWLVIAWAAMPGVLLARRLYDGHPGSRLAALLVGPLWGVTLTTLVLLALWAAGLRHWALLVIAPPLAILVCRPFDRLRGTLTPPVLTRRDARAALLVLFLVPLVVGWPYARVGADVPEGRAYRAYFTADVVWTMAVVAEVSKGDMPPRNQFLRPAPLHYYWTSHLLSAVEHRHLPEIRLERLVLLNGAGFGLIFVAFLYLFARQLTSAAPLAAAGVTAAILFTSFEGLERLVHIWQSGMPIGALRELNIDAVTRWFYGALPIDGLQRVLWYEPQHHGSAYALGLSALLMMAQARQPLRARLMVVVGVLLGASVLISAFSALMLTIMAALFALFLLVRQRAWSAILPCAIAAAIPLGLAADATLLLRYVDRSSTLMDLTVNPMALAHAWLTVPLSFGPMLVSVIAAFAIAVRRREPAVVMPGIVVLVSALFYVFVDVRDHQDVYVGWRSGHLIFMAGAALTAYVLDAASRSRTLVRRGTATAAVILAAAAAPTVVIDAFNVQDIDNHDLGPGFHWTLVLSRDELEALEWIRRQTSADAIVQVEPLARNPETWSYIPTFAERRMSGGLPISMVPLEPYRVASTRMRRMYAAATADEAYDIGSRNHVGYLVVGPPEREAHPRIEELLEGSPALFRLAFRNPTISIYELQR